MFVLISNFLAINPRTQIKAQQELVPWENKLVVTISSLTPDIGNCCM